MVVEVVKVVEVLVAGCTIGVTGIIRIVLYQRFCRGEVAVAVVAYMVCT